MGNIPAACSKSKIKKLFKACGTVESVRLHAIGSQQVDSVNAHVVMSSDEEAEKLPEFERKRITRQALASRRGDAEICSRYGHK